MKQLNQNEIALKEIKKARINKVLSMIKFAILIILVALLTLAALYRPKVNADAVFQPATSNITWTIQNPASGVFYAYSQYFNVGTTNKAYSILYTNKILAVVNEPGTSVNSQSTLGSYSYTTPFTSIDGYLNTITNFNFNDELPGATLYSDTQIRLVFVFNNVSGYSTAAAVTNYLESNVGMYLYSTLAPAFANNDNLSYWAGYEVGSELSYQKGYDTAYDYAYDLGYSDGEIAGAETATISTTSWFRTLTMGANDIMSIEIAPMFKLSYLIGMVMALNIVKWITSHKK